MYGRTRVTSGIFEMKDDKSYLSAWVSADKAKTHQVTIVGFRKYVFRYCRLLTLAPHIFKLIPMKEWKSTKLMTKLSVCVVILVYK